MSKYNFLCKICTTLNYAEYIVIVASKITGCVSISACFL